MNIVSTTALSGVQAASLRLDTAAHNIANAQTPQFQRQVVQLETQEQAGVLTTIGKAEEIGAALAADLVEQMDAAAAYRANLRSIQTDQQLTGSLLDIKA
ncbi:flagellar basal body rod protein [Aquabacterium fontiphilum]|jgi:flagellar hook protein FlgE|uniref:flagellar basal body protein n=1 Tax=Aquabacterium fontiphilum TaxID=450365 RepID=UPI001377D4AA|nr:flagellar basal body protein [Aquabacterium fontiphilum]NBD20525.1 flagellar basal body rod protein [Aquabacterium fontiphilum]